MAARRVQGVHSNDLSQLKDTQTSGQKSFTIKQVICHPEGTQVTPPPLWTLKQQSQVQNSRKQHVLFSLLTTKRQPENKPRGLKPSEVGVQ